MKILKLFKSKSFDVTAISGILIAVLGQFGVSIPMEVVLGFFGLLSAVMRWVTTKPLEDK